MKLTCCFHVDQMARWWGDYIYFSEVYCLLLCRCAGVFVCRAMCSPFLVWHHWAFHLPSIAGYLQSLFSQVYLRLTHIQLLYVVIGKAQCMYITACLKHQKPRSHQPTRSQYSPCVCMVPMEWPVLLSTEAISTQPGEMAAAGGFPSELMGYW